MKMVKTTDGYKNAVKTVFFIQSSPVCARVRACACKCVIDACTCVHAFLPTSRGTCVDVCVCACVHVCIWITRACECVSVCVCVRA